MKQYQCIFFDFFGVISCEVAPEWFKERFSLEKAKMIKDEIFTKADIGDIDEEETYHLIEEKTGVSYKEIKEHWDKAPIINKDVVNLIIKLKEKYQVYLLSNATSSYLRKILKKYNLEGLFNGIYISSEMHKIKPHQDFFLHVLNDLKVDASKCIMIDDNIKNLEGAKSIGIDTCLFKNVKTLEIELSQKLNF